MEHRKPRNLQRPRPAASQKPKPTTVAKGSVQVGTEMKRMKTTLSKSDQREDLSAQTFAPGVEPAYIRVGFGKTYNLGDFNSLRIDVAVTMPCHPDEVDKTYRETSDYCADRLAEEESQWLGN